MPKSLNDSAVSNHGAKSARIFATEVAIVEDRNPAFSDTMLEFREGINFSEKSPKATSTLPRSQTLGCQLLARQVPTKLTNM